MNRCCPEASRHGGTETAANPPSLHFGATGLGAFPPSPRLRRTGLPAILPSSPGYDGTGDRAFKGEL
jgi:hypothetical protein